MGIACWWLVACWLVWGVGSTDDDWSRFRGPNGSGVAEAERAPIEFGADRNVAWKTAVPHGSSSPVLTEDHVFLTASDDESLIVLCLDQRTGEVAWKRLIRRSDLRGVFQHNDSASPTPVTDGENVFAFFPEFGLVAYDTAGRLVWTRPLGAFDSFYGMASSPILAGDRLVLQCDQQRGSFLIAIAKTDGQVIWREDRPRVESWTTPVLYTNDRTTQIVTFGCFGADGYGLENGQRLWEAGGLGYTPVCSPIVQGGRLFVCVPYHVEEQPLPPFSALLEGFDRDDDGKVSQAEVPDDHPMSEHFGWADSDKDGLIDSKEWDFVSSGMSTQDYGLVAFDLEGSGSGSPPRELWRYKRSLPSIPSPLLYRGVLYLVRQGGILTSLDPETGEVYKKARLAAGDHYCASPIASAGQVYLANRNGQVTVVKAGPQWEVLATNEMGGEILATPALQDGRLYVRTDEILFCVGDAFEIGER